MLTLSVGGFVAYSENRMKHINAQCVVICVFVLKINEFYLEAFSIWSGG
jgi:hypothetical protein